MKKKKAIKELTEIKELFEEDLKENYEVTATLDQIDLESLVIVLNLIEKQQKEIERLEARKYMLNAETGEISQIPIDNNYISKDKIKAKIEEAEKIIKEDRKELNFGNTLRDDIVQGIVYKIDFNTRLKNILESLLEKE